MPKGTKLKPTAKVSKIMLKVTKSPLGKTTTTTEVKGKPNTMKTKSISAKQYKK